LPDSATLDVASGSSSSANLQIRSDANDSVSELAERDGSGTLTLRDRANAAGDAIKIELSRDESDRPIVVRNDSQRATTEFTTSRDAGGITVNDAQATKQVRVESDVVIEEEAASGVIEVYDDAGEVTERVEGKTGSVVLDGRDSGGDVLLQTVPTGDPDDHDVSVHATADANSSYGVSQDTRPLIFLNGPNAAVELGRQKNASRSDTEGPNSRGEGADGRLFLNYYDTEIPSANPGAQRLLEAGVGWPEGESMEQSLVRCGELVFRTATRGTEDCGMLSSCGESGLTFRTGEGTPALRIDDGGGIATAQPIVKGGLPLGPLDIVPTVVDALPGQVVDVDVDVGNLSTLNVRFGDEPDSGYELTATITDIQDSTITLRFDTGTAGDPATSTLSVQGNARLDASSVSETSLNTALDSGTYDVRAEYGNVADVATLEVKQVSAPWFDPEDIGAEEGDLVEFTVTVGKATKLTLVVGELDSFYGLEAVIDGVSATSLDLAFDTRTAGDPGRESLYLASGGDGATKQSVTEVDIDGSLPPGDYPVVASTVGGEGLATLVITEDLGG
jgi:hypothetical protein